MEIGATASAEVKEKPTLDQVLAYCKRQVEIFIGRGPAGALPLEQKEEIRQNAALRVIQAYVRLDASAGWRAFIQTHARGTVDDYLRDGKGFEESKWSLNDGSKVEEPEEEGSEDTEGTNVVELSRRRPPSIRMRVTASNDDGETVLNVEETAGIHGISIPFEDDEIVFRNPNWDLLARLASMDDDVHLFAKVLLGFSHTELAESFGVSRERLTQRIGEFWERLDSPEFMFSRMTRQIIFAFGLEEFFHIPFAERGDLGIGWDYQPVKLLVKESVLQSASMYQLNFFGTA